MGFPYVDIERQRHSNDLELHSQAEVEKLIDAVRLAAAVAFPKRHVAPAAAITRGAVGGGAQVI